MSQNSLLAPSFSLSQEEIERMIRDDKTPRVYHDYFESYVDSKQYKGEWDLKTKRPHGLGVMLWSDGSKYEG